jgi:hypothetical protein
VLLPGFYVACCGSRLANRCSQGRSDLQEVGGGWGPQAASRAGSGFNFLQEFRSLTAILTPREMMKAIMSAGAHNKWGTGPCGERLNIDISGH